MPGDDSKPFEWTTYSFYMFSIYTLINMLEFTPLTDYTCNHCIFAHPLLSLSFIFTRSIMVHTGEYQGRILASVSRLLLWLLSLVHDDSRYVDTERWIPIYNAVAGCTYTYSIIQTSDPYDAAVLPLACNNLLYGQQLRSRIHEIDKIRSRPKSAD